MKERNIDKYAAVNVAGDEFSHIIALALRSAIYGTQKEMEAVRNFIKDYKADLSDCALVKLVDETDVINVPQRNSEYLTEVLIGVYCERQRRQNAIRSNQNGNTEIQGK